MFNLATKCNAAHAKACEVAFPFVPSVAQIEKELEPIVAELQQLGHEKACEVIKAEYNHFTVTRYVLDMYKEAIKK